MLSEPSFTLMPPFEPDPLLPDLTAYIRPDALDIHDQMTDMDPLLARDIPSHAEVDASLFAGLGFSTLDVLSGLDATDPLLPSLQSPDAHVPLPNEEDGRPGDLDPSALATLHQTASYQQIASHHYPQVWMDQSGVNSTRARHLTLLDDGLTS